MLIFGNGRPYPGALLLRSEQSRQFSDQELLDAIKPLVENLNRESQDHARISSHMLVPIAHQEQPVEKSSKGTIIRKVADARFAQVIDDAYSLQDGKDTAEVADADLSKHLTGLIRTMTCHPEEPSMDTDLFSYGVDSIACMQLRTRLKRLMPNYTCDLPMSIIEDCGTVRRLTEYVLRKRHGESDAREEDEEQLMVDLVKQYGSFPQKQASPHVNGQSSKSTTGDIVVLTGATGALGAHLVDLLQQSKHVDTIYCLVRSADEHAARERVSEALRQRGLATLPSDTKSKVKVVRAKLSEAHLGLDDGLYGYLAREATSIIHVAWTVNFRLKLRSFVKDNIAGVRNLLGLALASSRTNPPRFTYCSSTASIMRREPDSSGALPEFITSNPASASPLGYSRSKWVAEHICVEAHNRTNLRGLIAVVRVGQLTGDSSSGVWNPKEAWPMMLSTARLIKCLPDLGDEPLDWLPVDIAARAFAEIAEADQGNGDEKDMPVYHVLNPHQQPTWNQMLQWLRMKESFEIVTPQEWIRKLGTCEGSDHSALKLLGLWKEAYGNGSGAALQRPIFSIEDTKKKIEALRDVQPLGEDYVDRMWDWIQANVR